VREIAKTTISLVLSVRLSIRMKQLSSHLDFREIWYSCIFRNSV